MRLFEHFPKEGTCLVCKTKEDKPCTLIGINGTQEGNNIQATPCHIECLELMLVINKDDKRAAICQMLKS